MRFEQFHEAKKVVQRERLQQEMIRNYRLRMAVDYLRQGFSSQEVAYKTGVRIFS